MKKFMYADESGNLDFRCHQTFPNGPTRYFAMGTLLIEGEAAMRALQDDVEALRHSILDRGITHDGHFHATSDSQPVRDEMFDLLAAHDFKVDVTILEKSKALPRIRRTEPQFYQYAAYYHLKHCVPRHVKKGDELLMVSAGMGVKKQRAAFRQAVNDVMDQCSPAGTKRKTAFWDPATHAGLQAIDYALWAVMRDIERGDDRSRVLVQDKINSVYDLWSHGTTHHYGPLAVVAKP